jgi:hypothetical protein
MDTTKKKTQFDAVKMMRDIRDKKFFFNTEHNF